MLESCRLVRQADSSLAGIAGIVLASVVGWNRMGRHVRRKSVNSRARRLLREHGAEDNGAALGCQALPQDGRERGVVRRVHNPRVGPRRMTVAFAGDNGDDKRIGASCVEVIGEASSGCVRKQVAEQEDPTAPQADLKQSLSFCPRPHDMASDSGENLPP